MIFLTATGWPVSWSLAELFHLHQREFFSDAAQGPFIPDEPESTHAHRLQIGVPDQRSIISSSLEGSLEGFARGCKPACDLERRPKDLGSHEFGHLVNS